MRPSSHLKSLDGSKGLALTGQRRLVNDDIHTEQPSDGSFAARRTTALPCNADGIAAANARPVSLAFFRLLGEARSFQFRPSPAPLKGQLRSALERAIELKSFFWSRYMLTRKMKLLAASVLLVLIGLGTLYVVKSVYMRWERQSFSSKLAGEVGKKRGSNNVVEIRFKDLTGFKWDKVYIFPPYTTRKVIDDDLGFHWKTARSIQMDLRDDVNLIVFTNDGEVVFYVEHPRSLGDIDGNYRREGYSPDEAIFTVGEGELQADGRPWLRMRWHKRDQ